MSLLVLRKAMGVSASSTAQLVASMPKLEPGKGNHLDVRISRRGRSRGGRPAVLTPSR